MPFRILVLISHLSLCRTYHDFFLNTISFCVVCRGIILCFILLQFRNFKIVYRRYAGLYFCICVDVNDNNLCYLEAIHNFVEVLNEYFHNVCELDLVFNFYKVSTTHTITYTCLVCLEKPLCSITYNAIFLN